MARIAGHADDASARATILRVRDAYASHFSAHPKTEWVLYPGLADHLGHEIAKRQMQGGYVGMMPIQVAGGRDAALRVAKAVRLFIPATSKACWNIAQPSKGLTVRFPIIFCASVSVSKMSAIVMQTSKRH
ncbi:MAG: PLP-dependent transferase [Pseudomonadota bacterium]|nr:PLP-dependent transferase [Pseudomonadota bacterium]